MIKNGIIALLLMVILNMMPGEWAVEGFRKFLVNVGLYLCLLSILGHLEIVTKLTIRRIEREIRKERNRKRRR